MQSHLCCETQFIKTTRYVVNLYLQVLHYAKMPIHYEMNKLSLAILSLILATIHVGADQAECQISEFDDDLLDPESPLARQLEAKWRLTQELKKENARLKKEHDRVLRMCKAGRAAWAAEALRQLERKLKEGDDGIHRNFAPIREAVPHDDLAIERQLELLMELGIGAEAMGLLSKEIYLHDFRSR